MQESLSNQVSVLAGFLHLMDKSQAVFGKCN